MVKNAIFIILLFLTLLLGCNDIKAIDNMHITAFENNSTTELLVKKLEEKIIDLEKQVQDFERKVVIIEAQRRIVEEELAKTRNTDYIAFQTQMKNIIVDYPVNNMVTFEIDKDLIGKYIVEDDPEMYFEIKYDGTVELSLNVNTGYAKYSSDEILLTVFYQENVRVYLSFNLVSGLYTLPGGLAVGFVGSTDYQSFLSTVYLVDYDIRFIKQ